MQCKGVRKGWGLIPAGPSAPTSSLQPCLLWELRCPKARHALAARKALLSTAPAQRGAQTRLSSPSEGQGSGSTALGAGPSPCCHPVGFQHSLPCPLLTGSAGPAGGGTRSGLGSPLQSKAEGQGGQEGSAVLGCPGSASWHAPGTTGAPAQLHATCRGSAPTQAGTRPWVLLPTPARGPKNIFWPCLR